MKIGVVTARDAAYHPNRRLLEAGADHGHAVELIHPYTVWPSVGVPGGEDESSSVLSTFEVILPRQGATVGDSSLALLRHIEALGVPLINGVAAILGARDKFLCAQLLSRAELPVPPAFLVNSLEGLRTATDSLGGYPVVLKPAADRQGEGVALLHSDGDAESILAGGWDRRTGLVVQPYFAVPQRRDLRLVVVGDRVVGGVELTPPEGEFRSNAHVGGTCRSVSVPGEFEALGLEAARVLGLEVAGVDLIVDAERGAMVLEVNYSPGFRAFEVATGLDVAGQIIDYAVAAGTTRRREAG